MAKVFILGLMAANIKANMRWTKSTDMEFINGQMVEFMKAFGSMANNMAKENTFCKMELSKLVNG